MDSCCSLQPCFSRRARLKALKFLNPIPPFAFGVHNFSHFIQAILHSSFFCPHQKLLTILFSSAHKDFGRRKQLIVWVGIAWTTALIKTSLPAMDRNFSFQLDSLCATLSLSCWKVFLLFRPTKDGKPRYFSCWWIMSAPNLCLTYSWISLGVLGLKKREVFWLQRLLLSNLFLGVSWWMIVLNSVGKSTLSLRAKFLFPFFFLFSSISNSIPMLGRD